MATPLPHESSVPENVTLVAASWQTRVAALVFFMEYVEPDSVVGIETEPAQAVLPVPSSTCSVVVRTEPSAST